MASALVAEHVSPDPSPTNDENAALSSKVDAGEHGNGTSAKGNQLSSVSNGHLNGDLGVAAVNGVNTAPQDEGHPVTNDTSQRLEKSSSVAQPGEVILSNDTVDSSTNPVLTPFLHPHPSTTLPTPAPLTPDQETKYTSLLATAKSWTTIPTSKKSQPPGSPPTPSEKLWLTRDCLLRYLRASKWVLATASTRLLATLTWRREYGVEDLSADYISEENETGKQVILGYDKAGRPCLYLNPHKQNTKGKDKQIQHLVFMLERCIDLMAPGVETLALLVNFKESRKGENASVGQGRETLSILQYHYPERLGRALVMDVPWLVWGFFKAIGPFIDPLTKEKLKFDEDLRELVPPEQLIKGFKGDVEFEYVHAKYWPALIELTDQRRRERLERWEKGGSVIGESETYLRGMGESVASIKEGKAA